MISEVKGTSHKNLKQATLYKTKPGRDMFCAGIMRALSHTLFSRNLLRQRI